MILSFKEGRYTSQQGYSDGGELLCTINWPTIRGKGLSTRSTLPGILVWLLTASGLAVMAWAIRESILIGRQVRDIERRTHLQREVQATCRLFPPTRLTRRWLHDQWMLSVGRDAQ